MVAKEVVREGQVTVRGCFRKTSLAAFCVAAREYQQAGIIRGESVESSFDM